VGLLIMAKYGVIVGLSFVGEDIEEAQVPIMIDALDLEEVFFELQGNLEYEYELREFVNQNYGELEFDGWKPKQILQFLLTEDGDMDEDKEPTLVWTEGDGE
jgi:hypothetical protein